MTESSNSLRLQVAGLLLAALGVTACDRGGTGPGGDEQQAARDNVEAMAHEHAEDTSAASPAVDEAPRTEVVSERMPYAEIGDELVYGHFVFPADMIDPLPAVIVIHEWWGLNDNVRAMADRLAGEGYIVLAVDLYGGATADDPEAARKLMLSVVENPKLAEDNIRQAYGFVNSEAVGAPRTASLGWCFGGGWSLNTALLFPDRLDAAVIYYGQVSSDPDKLAPIGAPILGFFGGADRGIPVESVRQFEAVLQDLGKEHDIRIYPDAGHAFANPTGTNYNAEAASDAWQRTLEFLGQKLAAGAPGS